jgi:hypothetical protein
MSGLYLSGAGKKNFVLIIETALPDQGTLLERNFFPEAGKPLSRNYRDFAGAAWALSRISLMPGLYYKCFTIVFYDFYDSGQYYKTTITIVICDDN